MSAVYDMVAGAAPPIDVQACRERRIGEDRVWRVGVFMLDHGAVFTGRAYIAERLGINERDVTKALEVLEASGILRRADKQLRDGSLWPSIIWEPGWEVSRTSHQPLDVEVDKDLCAREGIGYDRAWRIAVVAKHLRKTSAAVLAGITGIAERAIRKAAKVLGLALDRTVKERSWKNRLRKVKRMPWDIFAKDYEPDECVTPTRLLTREKKRPDTKLPRQARPVETWSPLDSAREFKERFLMSCPHIPGSTGDTAQMAKILGKMRKEFGHDARVEMQVLDKFLQDSSYLYRNPHIAPWRKFLSSFYHHYGEAEKNVQRVDSTYMTAENKHYVRRKRMDEAAKQRVRQRAREESKEREAELFKAMGYKDGVFV